MQVGPQRRTLVQATAALLMFAADGWWRRAAAEALLSQQAAEYQATPKELQMCGTCTLFVRPDRCKAVAGLVVRQGWCKLYDPVD